ncbi:MAG: glutamate-5-semialdehyde dehydrogenase [Oscillospiraceae bacterium]|jgi:glutamate-5-semialdehyde dehydrogenase|nr:glutamate-5-semialdehyde dehydrogenase [Oscillospiraceae bacterium]
MNTSTLSPQIQTICSNAQTASKKLASSATIVRDLFLERFAENLLTASAEIIAANEIDIAAAKANGIRSSLLDRLTLTRERIAGIADAARQIIALPDPLGHGELSTRPNGLQIIKKTVPLGVIGFIYEARPNVTADAAALCVKSGNAVILRGGKEAINSNIAIANLARAALRSVGLPEDAVTLITDTTRQSTAELMNASGYIDALIPRGGAGLINAVSENSKVPVIQTGSGICHLYVDESADFDMAVSVAFNAKCSRPSVCNAIEQLLVHRSIAETFLPLVQVKLADKNVELRGDAETVRILNCRVAADEDWHTEFGDYILAVKCVSGIDEAIAHIDATGTGHSEAIITNDYARALEFTDQVNAAAVYVNASTRFTDGGEFGLGAEIGISTQKLHARGPMGLSALTSSKFVIMGNGQVR